MCVSLKKIILEFVFCLDLSQMYFFQKYIFMKVYFPKVRKESVQAILCALVAISVGRIYIMVAECFYKKTKDTHDPLKRD